MAAVAAKGRTVLRNAACEPHVQDLARALVAMGAQIEGIGSNIYTIEGGRPLARRRYTIGPDHIEIGSFIGLAAVTNGAITIDPVRAGRSPEHAARLRAARHPAARRRARASPSTPIRSGGSGPTSAATCRSSRTDRGRRFRPTSCPPPSSPPRSAPGMLLVFEKMFESRLFFVDKLIGMGARIVLCDPHRAVISGPSPLKGGTVESPDIRAGMAMLLAALAAEGSSTIHNVGQIERGYERIDERLRALGADIERADG